jgi:O-antigen/teichoic acid export membrane protein
MSLLVSAARANLVLGPIGLVLAVATSVLIARWLGPHTFADYATLLAVLWWLTLLGEAGCNVGLQRYLAEAGIAHARLRFYWVLQLRRWCVVSALTVAVMVLGPVWAARAQLPAALWGPVTFGLIGVLAGIILHAQLAASGLLATFKHARAMTVANSMSVLRAAALGAVCIYFSEPTALVVALLAVALTEAALLHWSIVQVFGQERSPLPPGMANAAQRHGLVAIVDKCSTALTGSQLLLLLLAGYQERVELAVFAVAADTMQRALGIIYLPISNLVFPMLNDSRRDPVRFIRQVERLGGVVILVTAFALAVLAAAIPAGLPLLFGDAYTGAGPIALLWAFPLFVEAAARMIWGASLLTLDYHSWLMKFNVVFGLLSAVVVFAIVHADITTIVVAVGLLRLVMVGVLLAKGAKLGLLPAPVFPLRITSAAAAALALSWGVQIALSDALPIWRLLLGLGVFATFTGALLHLIPLIPERSYEVFLQLAGRYGSLLSRMIPQYWTPP